VVLERLTFQLADFILDFGELDCLLLAVDVELTLVLVALDLVVGVVVDADPLVFVEHLVRVHAHCDVDLVGLGLDLLLGVEIQVERETLPVRVLNLAVALVVALDVVGHGAMHALLVLLLLILGQLNVRGCKQFLLFGRADVVRKLRHVALQVDVLLFVGIRTLAARLHDVLHKFVVEVRFTFFGFKLVGLTGFGVAQAVLQEVAHGANCFAVGQTHVIVVTLEAVCAGAHLALRHAGEILTGFL